MQCTAYNKVRKICQEIWMKSAALAATIEYSVSTNHDSFLVVSTNQEEIQKMIQNVIQYNNYPDHKVNDKIDINAEHVAGNFIAKFGTLTDQKRLIIQGILEHAKARYSAPKPPPNTVPNTPPQRRKV